MNVHTRGYRWQPLMEDDQIDIFIPFRMYWSHRTTLKISIEIGMI